MRLGVATIATLLAVGMPLAGAPARADVHVGINIGVPPPPAIALPAPPPLVVVPGSPVYYAPEVPYNFFYYGGTYYVFNDGYWYNSRSAHGPWVFVQHVPRAVRYVPARYYHVPPGHLKHHGPPPWAGHGRGHYKHDDDHGHGHGHGHGKHD